MGMVGATALRSVLKNKCRRIRAVEKPLRALARGWKIGSPGRIRTYDRSINSRLLYR